MTIDTLKQAALDHLKDCSAASFMEPLEDGLWLCVGTKESIAERLGPQDVPNTPTARPELTDDQILDLVHEHLGLRRYRGNKHVINGATGRWTDADRYFDLCRDAVRTALATPPQAKEAP